MADINIFEDEAFSVSALTAAINELEVIPGRIGRLGLYSEEGVSTTVVQIEYDGQTLGLVKAAPRGSVAQPTVLAGRKMIPFNTVHLPQRATMLADEVQGIRAFGSMTELESAQGRVAKYQKVHRQQLDLTHEYQRVGGIKGLILDADGSTPLLNIYQTFGITQQEFAMELTSATTDIRKKSDDVADLIEDAIGATPASGVRSLCGKNFWKTLITHKSVKETYLNTAQAAELRGKIPDSFEFGGVTYERYRGKLGGTAFIGDDEAYAFPDGVSDFFITRFAPADYLETVNTDGVPYYTRVERLPFGKGLAIESQSNPLHLPTRPKAIIKLKIGS